MKPIIGSKHDAGEATTTSYPVSAPNLAALLLLPALLLPAVALSAQAQERMANSCPLVVKPVDSLLQPKRISPFLVKAKNAGGCLSPADAVYGPDGCPKKLCGPNAGVIELPSP